MKTCIPWKQQGDSGCLPTQAPAGLSPTPPGAELSAGWTQKLEGEQRTCVPAVLVIRPGILYCLRDWNWSIIPTAVLPMHQLRERNRTGWRIQPSRANIYMYWLASCWQTCRRNVCSSLKEKKKWTAGGCQHAFKKPSLMRCLWCQAELALCFDFTDSSAVEAHSQNHRVLAL